MKNSFKILLAFAIVGMFAFTGCEKSGDKDSTTAGNVTTEESAGHDHDHDHDHDDEEEASLSDWEGEWNSIATYADDEKVQGAYKEVAERDKITEEEAKQNFAEHVKVEFGAVKIEDGKITFYDAPNGNEIDSSNFEYVDKHPMEHGGKTYYWYEFKSDGKFEHVLLMPVHGEETMPHFHLRTGSDVESMLGMDDWYPTFVSPTVTLDQVYEEIAE